MQTAPEPELGRLANAASHDLKEPLRAVTGYLRLLESRHGEGLEGDARRLLDGAVAGAERMDAMVSGLVLYARAGAEGLTPGDTDATRLVEEALHALREAGDLGDQQVEVEPLPTVYADATHLRAVFRELIANAVRFGGCTVRVSGEAAPDCWRFAVEDDGIGIDPSQAERAFDLFTRLNRRHEYAGAGMGLCMCRAIVERHGGTIHFEPAAGGGSRFEFTLPR